MAAKKGSPKRDKPKKPAARKSLKTARNQSPKVRVKAAKPSSAKTKPPKARAKAAPKKTLNAKKLSAPPVKALKKKAETAPKVVRKAPAAVAKAAPPPPRVKPRKHPNALLAYESAIKSMHAEDYEKARSSFSELIRDYPEEPEVIGRARMLLAACEQKLRERKRVVIRSAEEHYDIAIAEMNARHFDKAQEHFQLALKQAPKADHVHYGLAAVHALRGNRELVLQYLAQAIRYRPENRFMAAKDADFEALMEDSDFQKLLSSPETPGT